MTKDMTQGNEFKLILKFSIPLILGQLFQQLYNIADRIIVGRFVSEDALGAVGTSFPIMFFTVALIMGLAMGATTVISQLYGAKQFDQVKRAVSTAIIFLGIGSVVLAIIGVFTAKPLLQLMQVDPDILPDATTYLRVIFLGIPFTFLYNAYSAMLRGLGNSKAPMYFLLAATAINIVLDLLFVVGFSMGIFGAALATVISQAVSSVLCLFYVHKHVELMAIKKGEWVFDKALFKKTIQYGVPSGVQQTILSLGFMGIQGLVNSYGKEMTSGITMASTLESISTLPLMNLGMALNTFTGQNVGAGRYDRVHKGLRATLIMNAVVYVVTFLMIYLLTEPVLSLFLPKDADPAKLAIIMGYGRDYIQFVSAFFFLIGVMFAFNNLLRGAGDVMIAMITTIVALGARLILAYSLSAVPSIGYKALWLSVPIGWFLSICITVSRYISGKWKGKGVLHRQQIPIEPVGMEIE